MAIEDVSDVGLADLISLTGRSAVVTGGAQGLGGASVIIGDLNATQADKAASELAERYGGRVLSTRVDMTDTASVEATADLAQSEFGSLDIWVNYAGLYPNIPLMEMTDETWDQVMAVNLRGVFASCARPRDA